MDVPILFSTRMNSRAGAQNLKAGGISAPSSVAAARERCSESITAAEGRFCPIPLKK